MSSARAIALDAVRQVTERGRYSNVVMSGLLRGTDLDRRDRAFASELAYGTLRRLLELDRAIETAATRPVGEITPGALAALRLGAYQVFHTDVPPHAAVAETVALVARGERAFVNAVLRRISTMPPPAAAAGDADGAIAARTGMAEWMVAELRRIRPDDVEEAARALARPGRLCLRVNACRASVDQVRRRLTDAGHDVSAGELDPACILVEGGDPAKLPGFDEGWFAVQDQASAFVVRALDPQSGERIWDACAGPGGKAVAIACAAGPSGFVVASDLHLGRAARVRLHAARLGVDVAVLAHDTRRPAVRGAFDRVLVDAPCSGIGAARRRPELLWRPERRELSRLARLQVAIVASAADRLRPGGLLVYAVCTFPRAETDAVADAIVRSRPDLRPTPTPGPGGPAPRHRLWPHVHGSDGMFVAAFRKDG